MVTEWTYDEESYRYYDEENDRYVTEAQLRALSERYLKSRVGVVDQVVGLLLASLLLPRWVTEVRDELGQTYYIMYLLGRGGASRMADRDWSLLSDQLRKQYGYLNNFASQMAAGGMSEAQIAARTALYWQSSRGLFEMGRTIGARDLMLPAYPGDGTSECGAHCKCWWRIIEFTDKWDCYWVRTAGESCPTCQARAQVWAPFVVYK